MNDTQHIPTGKTALLASFTLGVLMALSLPPAGFFPVLALCVPGVTALAFHAPTPKIAALRTWLFGCGFFIFGLYWISFALFVDSTRWGWLLPLTLIVGPSLLAVFYLPIPLLAKRYKNNITQYAFAFILFWSLIEWLRGHILTGFPWNLPGYTWHQVLPIMQTNAAVGIYGLTFLTLLWSSAPILQNRRARIFLLLSFLLVFAGGIGRLHNHPKQNESGHTVRIVQPNHSQDVKWDRTQQAQNLEDMITLTKGDPVDFVIWPETAVIKDLKHFPNIAQRIAQALPKGSHGLLGALRFEERPDDTLEFYNSVTVLDSRGTIQDHYDKHHLVPFGEYIPFRDIIGITPLALAIADLGDFATGRGPRTLDFFNKPTVSPLVCYEAIFPGAVADTSVKPDWLVNVTNDGWYGHTAGPYQHFENARVRAIEEGLPLVRAANTGISGTIDPLGRILEKTKLGEAQALDTILPMPLASTPYAQFGDLFFWVIMTISFTGLEIRRLLCKKHAT